MDETSIEKSGYMSYPGQMKSTSSDMSKLAWKSYYFILHSNLTLEYRESADSKTIIKSIHLQNIDVRCSKEFVNQTIFEIVTPKCSYHFKCESQKECKQWMNALQRLSAVHNENALIESIEREIIDKERHRLTTQSHSNSITSMRLAYFHKLNTVQTTDHLRGPAAVIRKQRSESSLSIVPNSRNTTSE